MRLLPILAILSVVLSAGPSYGQFRGVGVGGRGLPGFGAGLGLGMGGYGGYGGYGGFSSTIGEGYQRGMADVIRSAGAANLMDSQAAQNYQGARSQYLDNVLKGTETFFENRKMAKAYRDAERGPPVSREALYRMAKDAAPKRLSAGEYDPVTGDLSFPVVLQDPVFADACDRLRELFKTRTETGGSIGLKAYLEIESTAKELQTQLEARIRDYPPSAYVQAQNFLRSLAHEAKFAAG